VLAQIEYLTEHFKTDARVPVRHRGEQDWRQYRSALIRSALPHRWWDGTDTHLRLAHFEKNRRAGGYGGAGRGGGKRLHNLEGATHKGTVGPTPDHSDVARAIGLENLGELSGGLLFAATDNDNAATTVVARRGLMATGPTAAQQDAAARYNVLVAHLHDGIEVLQVRPSQRTPVWTAQTLTERRGTQAPPPVQHPPQLYSGQPLCRVPLGSDAHGEAVMHADVNGDGVLDHVAAVVGQGQGGCTLRCLAISMRRCSLSAHATAVPMHEVDPLLQFSMRAALSHALASVTPLPGRAFRRWSRSSTGRSATTLARWTNSCKTRRR